VYSNELAGSANNYFDRGFYEDDVSKIVFVGSPLEGTDMAVLGMGSPYIQLIVKSLSAMGDMGVLQDLWNASNLNMDEGNRDATRKIVGKNMEDYAGKLFLGLYERLKDPFLMVRNPLWYYFETAGLWNKLDGYKSALKTPAPLENYLGIRGEPRAWNNGSQDLMPIGPLDFGLSQEPMDWCLSLTK
jgi:hypothetical protein